MKIETTSRFRRRFKKLPQQVKEKAAKLEGVFRVNPFDSRLGTHKLRGDKKDEWAWCVGYSYRITFTFTSHDEALFTNVGTHDEVY